MLCGRLLCLINSSINPHEWQELALECHSFHSSIPAYLPTNLNPCHLKSYAIVQTWFNLIWSCIKKRRKLFASGSLEPMLSSSIATFNNSFIVMDVLFFLYIINNFLVGSCSCYCTFFSSSYYYYFFPSYNSNPDYRKTKLDMKKWFSQNVWNCLRAILSTVFMTGFRLVFTISRKRWFFNCTPVQQNWLIRFLWKFFWGYLGHLCIAERSLIEIS